MAHRRGYRPYQPRYRRDRLPPWLVFVTAVALVFGLYYLWIGLRDFVETGGLSIRQATERAAIIATATREAAATRQAVVGPTSAARFATFTPVPPCENFRVSVPVAIMRAAPATSSEIVAQLPQGEVVCVLGRETLSEDGDAVLWYLVDSNPATRRLDAAYMREDLIEAANPTPTPSRTLTALPTVTDSPGTPAATVRPAPTASETPPPGL
jgi:hypothetical protein